MLTTSHPRFPQHDIKFVFSRQQTHAFFAGDDDVDVAIAVVGAVHLAGAQCSIRAWLPLALEAVAAPKLMDASRANALVVLSALLYGAGESKLPLIGSTGCLGMLYSKQVLLCSQSQIMICSCNSALCLKVDCKASGNTISLIPPEKTARDNDDVYDKLVSTLMDDCRSCMKLTNDQANPYALTSFTDKFVGFCRPDASADPGRGDRPGSFCTFNR